MRKRFKFRKEPQPLRISTPDGISEQAFRNQLLITPKEAEALLEYCGYLQLKVYKKGDALYRNEQPFCNGTTRLRITSFGEIVKACLKLCNTLYEVERSRDYPNPDYITTILEDKQHLATIWERLTGQLAYDVDY